MRRPLAPPSPRRSRWIWSALGFLFVLAVFILVVDAWSAFRLQPVAAARSEADLAFDGLVALEATLRHDVDFAKRPTWDRVSGPDPYALRAMPREPLLVGILRGADAVVLLDASLHELDRRPAPAGAIGLTVRDDGTVYVVGEFSSSIARYHLVEDGFAVTNFELEGAHALRDIASGPNGWLYAVEEHDGRLITFRIEGTKGAERLVVHASTKIGNGPIRIERVGDALVVDCLLDHALVIVKLDATGTPSQAAPIRIVHDGPIWAFAARRTTKDDLEIVAAGVEDHPLDRTIGAFGYVDSFLFSYGVSLSRGEAVRREVINVSELGVVTPKAIVFEPASTLAVTGYATDKLVRFDDHLHPLEPSGTPFVPGATAALVLSDGSLAFADPLLDAWIRLRGKSAPEVIPVTASAPRSAPGERIGEALFFTTRMAPWNSSDGPLSRFTCETCHYEGYVDGRVHHTGRGDVHAVTKPLLGLWNNRPHFSRALDDDLVAVAFNEFRVAGAKSEHDPWFTLEPKDAPWLSFLGHDGSAISPKDLRKDLMFFLMAFNHRPNPMVLSRAGFTDVERAGAAVFRDRCESCHEARLASDASVTRVPFERWESLVFSHEGPIVWGKAEYQKTGVEPYVHEKGARIPSLRRLYKKRPYFTNGSAPDLEAVLASVRTLPDGFLHAPPKPDGGATLDASSRAALLAFLDLL
jgi:cytochrome c peroxidase